MHALGERAILRCHLRDLVEDRLQAVGLPGALLALGAQLGGALLHRGTLPGAEAAGLGPGILRGLPFVTHRFQVVPDRKTSKNRLHLDVGVSGGRAVPIETRRHRVDTEAARLVGLGAVLVGVQDTEGLDHYAVAMKDPEGNEFRHQLTAAATPAARLSLQGQPLISRPAERGGPGTGAGGHWLAR
jgi:Glyoxalase-like domain